MIKYRVNNKLVEEETFYTEVKKAHETMPQVFSYTEILDRLKTAGYARVESKKGRTYLYDYFYMADEQVFELEQIVAENEYDPEDCDAFDVAFAIYNKGFRKQ